MASANVNGVKIVGTRFAIIDLPEPGGPIMRMIGVLPELNPEKWANMNL
jgi:hypothetical protein